MFRSLKIFNPHWQYITGTNWSTKVTFSKKIFGPFLRNGSSGGIVETKMFDLGPNFINSFSSTKQINYDFGTSIKNKNKRFQISKPKKRRNDFLS